MAPLNRDPWGAVPAQRPVALVPSVPLVLWRGPLRVGRLHRRGDLLSRNAAEAQCRGELQAILVIDHAEQSGSIAKTLEIVVQRPRPFSASGELMHHVRPAWDLTRRARSETHIHASARGSHIDADDAFAIRDAHGRLVAFRVVSLHEVRLGEGHDRTALHSSIPREAIVENSLWLVSAFQ